MAQVEFTETLTLNLSAGLNTNQYLQLGATIPGGNAGSFVIKSMTYYSSAGIVAGPPYSVQIATNTTNSGSGIPIFSNSTGDNIAYEILRPYTLTNQIILTAPWLAFNVNMTNTGIFTVVVSYSFIPAANTLSGNFLNFTGNVASGATGAAITGSSVAPVTIIKSIYVVNNTLTGPTTFTLKLNGNNLDETQAAFAQGATYQYTQPIYINSSQTIQVVNNPGGAPVQVFYSYTEDPA